MLGEAEQTVQQASEIGRQIVDEAVATAAHVQQRASEIQAQSQSVPPRAPVENAASIPDAGAVNRLFWFGLGAVGALGLAYYLMKKEDK